MIKCNQCGKMNAAGAVNCQLCGAPLSNMVDGGMSPRAATLEQPELPAWLESLRAGERSAAPTNSEAHFSPADFIDEDSLPSWMRAERNETRDNTGAYPQISVRQSSVNGPATDGNYLPPTGIPAQSLLDEQALPSWMREAKSPDSAQEKIAASSLVQPDNVPDWMKSLYRDQAGSSTTSSQVSAVSQPQMSASPQQSAGVSPSGSQSASLPPALSGQGGFSARDLIDPQSLPSWMMQQGGQAAQSPQAGPVQTNAQSASLPTTSPALSGQGGFSARDLIDPQSLPSWMMQQGGQAAQSPPAGSAQTSAQSASLPTTSPALSGQGGFSARDLIDPQSLPSWMMQQSGQATQPPQAGPALSGQGGFSAQDLIDPQSLPSWMMQQGGQATQPPQAGPALSGQGGFSARDLIDPQSLPSWMMQQGGQATQSPQVSQPDSVRNSGPATPGQTFSAASLQDANSVPTWLREVGQEGQTQLQPGPIPGQPLQAPSAPASSPVFGGTIPASSFLDPNSVPSWMHQSNSQQPNSGSAVAPQSFMPQVPRTPEPNVHAIPPKVENVRVPNRPRNERNPNENSEVAANVFSSVLGVASSTPNYPASAPPPSYQYQQPGISGSPAQPNMGYPMSQSGMGVSGSGNYAQPGMGAVPHTPNTSSNMPQGYAPSNSYGNSYPGGMGSTQLGYPSAAGIPPQGQRPANVANEHKSSKKRGLFGAILEWLAR